MCRASAARTEISAKLLNTTPVELGTDQLIGPAAALNLSIMSLLDILVFFGVLLVGFAYVWKRGDLDWVRAVAEKAKQASAHPRAPPAVQPEHEPQTVGSS